MKKTLPIFWQHDMTAPKGSVTIEMDGIDPETHVLTFGYVKDVHGRVVDLVCMGITPLRGKQSPLILPKNRK